MSRPFEPRAGITLVEVLVVLTITSLLLGLLLAGVQSVRTAAARADCQNRMRQLGLSAHSFHATHRHFPEGVSSPYAQSDYEARNRFSGLSWQTSILPYLEQETLWRRAWEAHSADPSGSSAQHSATAAHTVPSFRCPTDSRTSGRYHWTTAENEGHPGWGLTNYLGVAGTGLDADNGVFHLNKKVSVAAIADGTSNTLMIGERPTGRHGYGSSWYSGWGTLRYFKGQLMPVDDGWANAPISGASCPTARSVFEAGKYDDPCHHHHFWSLHPGGANFTLADGSVKFLRFTSVSVLSALATRAGGETIGGDW